MGRRGDPVRLDRSARAHGGRASRSGSPSGADGGTPWRCRRARRRCTSALLELGAGPGHRRHRADADLRGDRERGGVHRRRAGLRRLRPGDRHPGPASCSSEALDDLRADGTPVAAVVPVDLLGRCADYTRLAPICERFGVPVLSDAAEALRLPPRRPAGRLVRRGRRAVVQRQQDHDDQRRRDAAHRRGRDLADRVRYLSTQARQPAVHYEHTEIGYNYRLSNVLAALGLAQLERLDEMIDRRRALRGALRAAVQRRPRRADLPAGRRRGRQLLADGRAGRPRRGRLVGRRPAGGAGRGRHRVPAAVEADAPPAGLRRCARSLPGRRPRSGCSPPA